VSEWDVQGTALHGPLAPGEHYVSGPGGGFKRVTTEELYEADRRKPGRPLRFSLADARRIKDDYWDGVFTIADLARQHECTTVTISRIVHAHTMWYV